MNEHIIDIAHVIQLSVAPAFLLAAIGALLGVLTGRLNRIVDRARLLEKELPAAADLNKAEMHAEFARLSQRARLVNSAIVLATVTGLMISLVIAALFLGDVLAVNLSKAIATLFILGMLSLIGAFTCFLREIVHATAGLRIGPRQ